MGNSNENICSCADDNQRISINTSSQIKIRPTFENDPIQLSANYNNDMGDNCHFFENNKSYQKQTNFNIEPSFHNSKIKRQITFGNDFQNNNYNEKPNRLSNLPKQIDKVLSNDNFLLTNDFKQYFLDNKFI